MHLTIAVTTNSCVILQQCPSNYYVPPNSELLMRWDENGTETGTLINPHLPHVHYMALKRVFDPKVRSMKQCMLDQVSDAHQLIFSIITAGLEG